jgi:hypothetical protein
LLLGSRRSHCVERRATSNERRTTMDKPAKTSKSFLAVGPTLHYSHSNVQRCWLLAAFVFSIACLFWSRIVTGTFWAFDLQSQNVPDFWHLGRSTVTGISIFEYPWQIIVLGLLMGILAVVPVLIAQLMSFGHSLIFIFAVFFLANLPGFALCLLVSCLAVACRPLRFRSRIIAVALCTAPQLLYWGFLGSAKDVEPLEWGFSFAPWLWAWIVSLAIAGLVLGIGHYSRYRPGLNWIFTTTTLLLALGIFEWTIGFDELDYQFYIADNNPEEVQEFHDHSIRQLLDRTIMDPATRKTLTGFFLPTDPIPLREEIKREIQIQLNPSSSREECWPVWLAVPPELQFQEKRKWLNEQYDRFMRPHKSWWMPKSVHDGIVARRSKSKRMPIALYFRALLSELSPDLPRLGQDEVLHFYSDYPHERAGEIWFDLYRDYGTSPESAEARWRIAKHLAGRRLFGQADTFLDQAAAMVKTELETHEKTTASSDSLLSAFRPPAQTVMTAVKLRELQRRIYELKMLIAEENRKGGENADEHLARFVMLNPHSLDYEGQLDVLLTQVGQTEGLRDNLLLAKAKLIPDDMGREEQLSLLNRQCPDTDGGMEALYELARLSTRQFQNEADTNRDKKRAYLAAARERLTQFLDLYPDSFYAEQVKKNLDDLPRPD